MRSGRRSVTRRSPVETGLRDAAACVSRGAGVGRAGAFASALGVATGACGGSFASAGGVGVSAGACAIAGFFSAGAGSGGFEASAAAGGFAASALSKGFGAGGELSSRIGLSGAGAGAAGADIVTLAAADGFLTELRARALAPSVEGSP